MNMATMPTISSRRARKDGESALPEPPGAVHWAGPRLAPATNSALGYR